MGTLLYYSRNHGAAPLISTYWVLYYSGVIDKEDLKRPPRHYNPNTHANRSHSRISQVQKGGRKKSTISGTNWSKKFEQTPCVQTRSGGSGFFGAPIFGHQFVSNWPNSYQILQQILEVYQGFNSFMIHLTKEFSVENLLFIVEMKQFESFVLQRKNHGSDDCARISELNPVLEHDLKIPPAQPETETTETSAPEEQEKESKLDIPPLKEQEMTQTMQTVTSLGHEPSGKQKSSTTMQSLNSQSAISMTSASSLHSLHVETLKINFPKDIPKSSIVYGNKENMSIYDKWKLLMEKYVLSGSQLEINIPWWQRHELMELYSLENLDVLMNKKEISGACDKALAIWEIWDLMQSSFRGFRKSEEFEFNCCKTQNMTAYLFPKTLVARI